MSRRSKRSEAARQDHGCHHEHVIAGAVEKFQEHVATLAGAIVAEHALILGESFQFGTRDGGDLMQNLVEAGIGRFDFEAAAVPGHPGLVGRLVVGRKVGVIVVFIVFCF